MIGQVAYQAHSQFIAPARARSEVWRLLLGLFVFAFCYLSMVIVYFPAMEALFGPLDPKLQGDLPVGRSPLAMLISLFSFALMILSVLLTLRALHNRPLASVFGPFLPMLGQFRAVALVMAVMAVVIALLPPWDMGAPMVSNLALGTWAMLLPLSLLAVLIQVSAEEILFRGYVQQQLAARFASPLIWMVLPAALFALGHYTPAEAGENAVMIAVWAGVFGLLMADLTARSGTLGPAIAVHFVNNVWAMLLTSMPDNLSGLALYHLPFGLDDPDAVAAWLPVDFAMMFVFWLVARLAIRR